MVSFDDDFIILTQYQGSKTRFRKDHISTYYISPKYGYTSLFLVGGDENYGIRETPEEIDQMLGKAYSHDR